MPNGRRDGGGWSGDQPEWVRPVPRDRRPGAAPRGRATGQGRGWGGETPWLGESDWGGGRPRRAVHDPWRQRPRPTLPPALPTVPVAILGVLAVILAFVIGRATAGGGGSDNSANASVVVTSSTTTTTLTPLYHTVMKGETLASIASQYGVTVNDLAFANNIGNINVVYRGLRLKIPQTTTPTTAVTTTKTK